jgi:chromosome segregation ATPase
VGEVAPLLQGGIVAVVLTVLVSVIGYLLASNRSDRTQALDTIAAAADRASDAEKRADDAEDRERTAQQRLDAEREKRRAVEDELGKVLQEIRELRFQVGRLQRDLDRYAANANGGGTA